MKGRVEKGHQGHGKQHPEHFFQPMLPPQLQPADYAGHAEQGQPGSQGGPLGLGIRGEVGPGGQVRREEEALQNVQVPLVAVIKHGVPAVDHVVHPVVLQHRQHRGQQKQAGEPHAGYRFQRQQQKVFEREPPAAAGEAQEKVDEAEGYLAHKKVIVDKAAGKHSQGEQAPAAGFHVFVQSGQQQGEKDNGLMKVVKENIIDGKPGKGVQHRANHGGVRRLGVAVQIHIARKGGAGKLKNQQRAH